LAWLLLFFAEWFSKLLYLLALAHAVVCRVLHQASGAADVTAGCLSGALLTLWASAPTCHHNCGCGGMSQRLVIAVGLLFLVVVVAVALSNGPTLGLLSLPASGLGEVSQARPSAAQRTCSPSRRAQRHLRCHVWRASPSSSHPSHPSEMQPQQKHWRYKGWCCEPERTAG
jgi:hypothetical protein